MKLRNFCLFAILVQCLFWGNMQVSAQDAPVHRISMTHWIAFSPLNVADVKGFWKEQGLNIEVMNYSGEEDGITAFKNKKLDLDINMIGTYIESQDEYPPSVLVAETDWSNGGDKIIVKKDFDLANLKGKKVGVYDDKAAVTFFLSKFLATKGLKLSDVQVVTLDPQDLTANFLSGRLEAIVNYDPQALKAEREGNGKVVATSADYPGVIPEGIYLRTGAMSDEEVVKFFKGLVKAVEWLKTPANWTEYMQILNSKTFEGEEPYSEQDLKDMLASVKIHGKTELQERNKTGLQQYVKELGEFMKANGKLQGELKVEEMINTTAILKALE